MSVMGLGKGRGEMARGHCRLLAVRVAANSWLSEAKSWGLSPTPAVSWLAGLGQVAWPLGDSVSLPGKWEELCQVVVMLRGVRQTAGA